jgi:acyl-CoA thioesterase-1
MAKGASLMTNFRGIGLAVFACLTVAGCGDGAPVAADKGSSAENSAQSANPAPVDPDARLIVAFGDSLYAGYGLDREQGFAPELEKALKAEGLSVAVHNAGVSGDTTAAGLARLGFALDGLPRKPDLVIVGLGGNDMLRGIGPEQTRANLDAILTELDRRQIPAMLTGMLAAPNLGADYSAAFNPIFPELARKHSVPLYPFFLEGVVGNAALMLPDSIHPNAAGVDVVIGKLAPQVAQALAD